MRLRDLLRITVFSVLAACSGSSKDVEPTDDTDPPVPDCLGVDVVETCNGVDDNCNGMIDEDVLQLFYRDNDGDSFGQDGASVQACEAPDGFVPDAGDCVDYNLAIYPGAPEQCNGADDDCNGVVDDGLPLLDLYPDLDGDGFAPAGARSQGACAVQLGFTTAADVDGDGTPDWDCDDSNTLAFPFATERCNGEDDDCDAIVDEVDNDGDGFYGCPLVANRDCDDANAAISPTAAELCDQLDQNCNGQVDEGVLQTWFRDNDNDAYGQDAASQQACARPAGFAPAGGDCGDFNPAVNPAAPEQCNGEDDDCDGLTDEGVSTFTLYTDADGDGVPQLSDTPQSACVIGAGLAEPVDVDGDGTLDWDCDDGDSVVSPGAVERCNGEDDDCDALVDELDADGDGYSGCPTAANRDCDDADADVAPGRVEACDGRDDNCNGLVDEGALTPFYRDSDGDGFGQDAASVLTCTAPAGFVALPGDCVDYNASIFPGAPEQCNDVDDDCSGVIDDNLATLELYPDQDGDGFAPPVGQPRADCAVTAGWALARDADGDGALDWDCDDSSSVAYPGAVERCNGADDDCDLLVDETDADGDGFSGCPQAARRDCDDADPAVFPTAPETCDGLDQDCDGQVDEGVLPTWFRDNDGDGYGQDGATQAACEAPAGYADQGGDCVDFNAQIAPGAPEQCNNVDDDCDGLIDDAVVTFDLYPDADGDGFPGDAPSPRQDCELTFGWAPRVDADGDGAPELDCDDTSPVAFPGAVERCNGGDDDCDAEVDEVDADGDGFAGCPLSPNRDCDDTDPTVRPGAPERCDGRDQSCDGRVDEGVELLWFRDSDRDGWGQDVGAVVACEAPAGFVGLPGDCVDLNAAIHPEAPELCNSADDDCDFEVDEGLPTLETWRDVDGDGFGSGVGVPVFTCRVGAGYATAVDVDGDGAPDWDCDDSATLAFPGATERCNGGDDDCDLVIDEIDNDGDGFYACPTAANRDCDDDDVAIRPGAVERCDGIDEDCDGVADDGAAALWFRDNDGDGFGQDAATTTSCAAPAGYVPLGGDCVDFNRDISPGAAETCNGADDDCNGVVDDGLPDLDLYPDTDGDGFPPQTPNVQTGCVVPLGFTTLVDADGDGAPDWDCDDLDTLARPNGTEVCNGTDDDCDAQIDEIDADNDGYFGCPTVIARDCDDADPDVNPGERELCNTVDENCNGLVDEGVLLTFFRDNDGDGYGQDAASVVTCARPPGYADVPGDCIDFNPAVRPLAAEVCNDLDDDCDGVIDEGLALVDIFPDLDGDGYAALGAVARQKCNVPLGFAAGRDANADGTRDWDCDDSNTLAYPLAPEICGNDVDEPCSGVADRLCFNECPGVWPFTLNDRVSRPEALNFVELDGDGTHEIIVQDDFGFAILDHAGDPLFNYSAPVFNYSRNLVVLADIDDYDVNTASRQTLEVLTANGSYPLFYKLNTDDTITTYNNGTYVYDASRFMARDLDGDGGPEFLTTTWCGANSTEVFRFDRATGTIVNAAAIAEPDAACEYTDGRTLTDLDSDGDLELIISNGYAVPSRPDLWSGRIHALQFTNLRTLTTTPYCAGCFNTDVPTRFRGQISDMFQIGGEIRSYGSYFSANVPGAANPSDTWFWRHDLAGATLPAFPTRTSSFYEGGTDLDRDGHAEAISDSAYVGLIDVNGDSVPDRIYASGTELRVGLYDPATDRFVDYAPASQAITTDTLTVYSMWDADDDGRVEVLSGDTSGRVFCHQLGDQTFRRESVVPPHIPLAYRTYQWDNTEPNEGADTSGDGIPDAVFRVPSALTADGDFYGWLSTPTDVDTYLLDAGYSANVCVEAPADVPFQMRIWSFRDVWNNTTRLIPADGVVDGLIWEDSGPSTRKCFAASSVSPPRNGEYKLVLQVAPTATPPSPYWPYWVTAPK